ncbi:MAG: hypothetical protein EP340_02355 [Alphaproteobacteria bacterium]|nr:MAG: hypothetical protein EP340_02355 [Alphaproteobacteria bacterium]
MEITGLVPATALYAGLNAVISVALAFNVGRNRMRAKVSLGTGDDDGLFRATRAHANNVEYTPIALILLLSLELMAAMPIALHVLGIMLTAGRALHGYGMTAGGGTGFGRSGGIMLTMLMILASAGYCIFLAVS